MMNNKIRLGIIGAGRWGPNLIRNFHTHPETQVVAVADRIESRQKLIQEKYPEIQVSGLEDNVLNNPNVDAVVICTPTNTHFELAQKALQNKKHVFVEKPLAQTTKECNALVELAEKVGKTLFVGHIFVYNAGIQAVRRYIKSGELGKINYIHATRTNLGPVRNDVNALWDLAPHDLSIFNYWLDASPTKVSATGACYLNPKIEDVVFATYTFPGNILANVHVSWLNPKKIREIVIVGEKKMLLWDDMDLSSPIRLYDKKISVDKPEETVVVDTFVGFRTSIFEGDTIIPKIQLNEPLSAECAVFIKAIKDPNTSLSTGRDGAMVVSALEATDESMRLQGKEASISYCE
jgi:predicted dehydrogenase